MDFSITWHGSPFYPGKWPVQNKSTSIQYSVQILNTEVSISVFTIKNTENIISISTRKKLKYQYSVSVFLPKKCILIEILFSKKNHIKFVHEVRSKDCSPQFMKQASKKKRWGNHNGNIYRKRNHFIALFVIKNLHEKGILTYMLNFWNPIRETSNKLFFQLFKVHAQEERDSDILQCPKCEKM